MGVIKKGLAREVYETVWIRIVFEPGATAPSTRAQH